MSKAKRFLSILLSVIMIATVIPANAFADGDDAAATGSTSYEETNNIGSGSGDIVSSTDNIPVSTEVPATSETDVNPDQGGGTDVQTTPGTDINNDQGSGTEVPADVNNVPESGTDGQASSVTSSSVETSGGSETTVPEGGTDGATPTEEPSSEGSLDTSSGSEGETVTTPEPTPTEAPQEVLPANVLKYSNKEQQRVKDRLDAVYDITLTGQYDFPADAAAWVEVFHDGGLEALTNELKAEME